MDVWRIERVEIRELDCSFSEPASETLTQLVADGEVLANAVGYTRWGADPVQVELCAECGVAGCAPQGWVRPRRAGDRLLWLPAFDELVEDLELGPPRAFARRGVPLFEPDAARTVVEMMSRELDDLQPLTLRDVALLLQWTAPGGLLDAAPTPPRVRREDVLAVTSGDRDETLDALDRLLSAASASESPVVLREAAEGHERTGLFLDLPGHPEWSPMVRVDERVELAFGDLVVGRSS
ncbi:MAG: hypothetical protein SangKO_069510 [Sandaracinaceae bacterium]